MSQKRLREVLHLARIAALTAPPGASVCDVAAALYQQRRITQAEAARLIRAADVTQERGQ